MDGSRLLGGKLPINLSNPLVRRTAFKPLSPITSCAEVNACRTSELMIIASSLVLMLSLHLLPIKFVVTCNVSMLRKAYFYFLRISRYIESIHGKLFTCAHEPHTLIQ